MEKLSSILVVVERSDYVHRALAKAVVLARHFGARLELFLCDSERAHALSRLYDLTGVEEAKAACLADARRYLESMRLGVAAQDIDIALDVACESPMYEGVLRKILRSSPDLVIKTIDAVDTSEKPRLSASDWQLVRTCPVPLMITRGRPWQPQPRFAAAVDVSAEESPGMSRAIVHTAEHLALGCNAALDVIYSERADASIDVQMRGTCETALRNLAYELSVDADHVRLLDGDPDQTLPRFVSEQRYDVLALGALTHKRALAALVDTLTGRLLDALECDFLLIKPASYVCPIEERPAVLNAGAQHPGLLRDPPGSLQSHRDDRRDELHSLAVSQRDTRVPRLRALLSYIARSAFRSSVAWSRPSSGYRLTPILQETVSSLP